jgi:hypothetical protein
VPVDFDLRKAWSTGRLRNSPNATPPEVVSKILYLRQNYHFGPRTIAAYLKRFMAFPSTAPPSTGFCSSMG